MPLRCLPTPVVPDRVVDAMHVRFDDQPAQHQRGEERDKAGTSNQRFMCRAPINDGGMCCHGVLGDLYSIN